VTVSKPLPERMRPDDLALFLGQTHLGDRLRSLMKSGRLPSLLFFGPPGCGKSTLALLLAKSSGKPYLRLSAPEAGLQHLRRSLTGVEILVLDELHRFSKAQQDFFLPLVESGELTLLATTTENPSFSVTRQLLSRLHVLRLRPLGRPELMELARRGAKDMQLEMTDDVADLLAGVSHGDARTLLNLVEYVGALPEDRRDLEHIKAALPEVLIRHDKDGDNHYELASALIKSIRGSDVDAALYYLACLLEGGEDPRFVCRRLILSASEDVGLADPDALGLAVACQQAVEFVGMPEGFIPAGGNRHLSGSCKKEQRFIRGLSQRRPRGQTQRDAPGAAASAQSFYPVAQGMGLRQGIQVPPQLPGIVDRAVIPADRTGRTQVLPAARQRRRTAPQPVVAQTA